MKKLKSILLMSAAALVALTSCEDDVVATPTQTGNIVKEGVLTTQTWSANKVYQLSGRVVVGSGATLTIEPGTIIKAEGGREANASALIVARGGKIMANGSVTKPIIFTSVLDEIQPGETVSPNLDETFSGLWGGVIILGNASISADAAAVQIEGIPPSDANGLYGGSDDADNSGELTYVSIRHGGTLIGEGNEINGLTLGGVGSGTKIENIEIVANVDDGIECFGGTVNVSNILVWGQGDDAFDIDQAYAGTITNFMGIAGSESDHGFEIDGPEGTLMAGFTMTNGTMIGYNKDGVDGGEYADFRDGARGTISNVYWRNFSESSDVELDDDASSTNYKNGDLKFNNWEFDVSHLTGGNTTVEKIFADKSAQGGALADLSFSSIVTSATVGANSSDFAWTWAAQAGKVSQ